MMMRLLAGGTAASTISTNAQRPSCGIRECFQRNVTKRIPKAGNSSNLVMTMAVTVFQRTCSFLGGGSARMPPMTSRAQGKTASARSFIVSMMTPSGAACPTKRRRSGVRPMVHPMNDAQMGGLSSCFSLISRMDLPERYGKPKSQRSGEWSMRKTET